MKYDRLSEAFLRYLYFSCVGRRPKPRKVVSKKPAEGLWRLKAGKQAEGQG